MDNNFFVSIDFDGTVINTDITDAIIKEFARPEWEHAERLWEDGKIGSRDCLANQMSLIDAPIEDLLAYTGDFAIDNSFISFIEFLRKFRIPHAIISDGFKVFIERLLADAGVNGVPVYANRLTYEKGSVKAVFPYTSTKCSSGTCKCRTSEKVAGELPVIHVGDGRSDFCLAEKAAYVFARGKLSSHCMKNGLAYSSFDNFNYIEKNLRLLIEHTAVPTRPLSSPRQDVSEQLVWNAVR